MSKPLPTPPSILRVPSLGNKDDDYIDGDFEDLSYGDGDNVSNQSDADIATYGFTQKEISIPSALKGMRFDLETKAKSLNLTYYFSDSNGAKIILVGEGNNLAIFLSYFKELSTLMEKSVIHKLMPGDYTQKSIMLTRSFHHFKHFIDKMAENLELIIEYDSIKLIAHGYQRRIKQFMVFLYEKENEYGPGQILDRTINISTFNRIHLNDIKLKINELKLKVDFGYDTLFVRGPEKLIDSLVLYLMETETKVRRALFPKFWDFTDNNSSSMVPLNKDTEEFRMVKSSFYKSISREIFSVQRIQNKYLMDQYITVINKKMEEYNGKPINRRLLFHGTRNNDPEKVYKNFDTGFDLQYAAFGAYGKGLYFAQNASYSSSYGHCLSNGNMVMFLADVYVGKAYKGNGTGVVKAPDGYDSIYATGSNFYIVYHNFHSYPLYLIEYKR